MSSESESEKPRGSESPSGELGFALPEPAKLSRSKALTVAGVVALVMGAAFVARFLPRHSAQRELEARAAAVKGAAPRVVVGAPKLVSSERNLKLPASVQPLEEAVIYSRANGYVARWVVDLGDKVKADQLLAEIETPELNQELSQARATLAKAQAAKTQAEANRALAISRFIRTGRLTDAGVAVTVDAAWDSPLHEGIIRKALASNADLVLKDTHYHTALKRSIFSNTDWNLIRKCPVPLWLVKPRTMRSEPCFVAAIDPVHERDKPAELDDEILSIGAELSVALEGRLEVFHAFDVVSALAVTTGAMSAPLMLPVPELIDAVKTRHADAVNLLTDRYKIARERVHLEQGGTRDRLLALTERLGADVVVMGAVSRRGLARVFIGNTAEDVLDRLGCDLLIVKPRAIVAALRTRAAA